MKEFLLRRALPLDAAALLRSARGATGREDLGPPPVEAPLRALTEAADREARLSAFGRLAMRGDIRRTLVNRLLLERDRERYPAIADERIERPLVITGLPRTGTTLLHALLAQDPAHRAPLTWEVMHPSPPPAVAADAGADRIARTARQLRWLDRLVPRFQAIHEVGAELPQECIAITAHSFMSLRFIVTHDLPGYKKFLEQTDARDAYGLHRRFLQHLQYAASPRRWVLKAPGHLPHLDALLEVYPDAQIVQTHRDPTVSIPSLASLRTALRSCFSRRVDPASSGPEVAAYWAHALERADDVRRSHAEKPFYDVEYDALMADPIGTLRELYRRLGRELDADTEARMRAYLDANPQGKHGRHAYTAEQFGLKPGMVEDLFADYRARMGWSRGSVEA